MWEDWLSMIHYTILLFLFIQHAEPFLQESMIFLDDTDRVFLKHFRDRNNKRTAPRDGRQGGINCTTSFSQSIWRLIYYLLQKLQFLLRKEKQVETSSWVCCHFLVSGLSDDSAMVRACSSAAALLLESICSSRKLKLLLPSPAFQGTTPALPNPFHPLFPGSLNSQQQTQGRTLPVLPVVTNFNWNLLKCVNTRDSLDTINLQKCVLQKLR